MNADTIREGFKQLRTTCDPRGHDLLDALELTVLALNSAHEVQDEAIDRLDGTLALLEARDRADTLISRVVPPFRDGADHSKVHYLRGGSVAT